MIKRHRTFGLMIVVVLVVVMALVFFGVISPARYTQQPKINLAAANWLKTPVQSPSFKLMDNKGHVFTEKNLDGHWTLLFVGNTQCGDTCNKNLDTLGEVHDQLQNQSTKENIPQVVVFATDISGKKLLNRLNNDILTVTATPAQAVSLEQAFTINDSAVDDNDANHAKLLIIDRNGQLRGYFNFPTQSNQVAYDYMQLVATKQ